MSKRMAEQIFSVPKSKLFRLKFTPRGWVASLAGGFRRSYLNEHLTAFFHISERLMISGESTA